MPALLLALFVLAATSLPAFAQDKAAIEAGFRTWLTTKVWPDAQKKKVSKATFDTAFSGVTLDWTLPDLAAPGAPPAKEQRQPEFQTPGAYVAETKFAPLVPKGRALLQQYARTLDAVEKKSGVPREIIVAIWGRESGFGAAKPNKNAIQALATLGYIGARKNYFYPELIAALEILEGDHIALADLKSSWAGAMGQPQFLPSKFLAYAVDQDGDGKRDIWKSVPDTLGSIGNFLAAHGWVRGRWWGTEIDAPQAASCTYEGPDKPRPVKEWLGMGVKPVSAVMSKTPDLAGHLLMPAGRQGPAFLVSENFYVLKSYNESDMYALFIGHLADKLRGDATIRAPWNTLSGFTRNDVREMQLRLEKKGQDVGTADGLVGFRTRVAIGVWQQANGRAATCYPDADMVKQAGR
ncbi:lytic murein transglycosylase [Flaviflagellibacter deserti]|uniref:Lytic murein transglycosylase n=1 Tax=Flaviflagellibacter deserti TaxID=2267266 RepID=A0ABV9Z317_9HYPH